MKKLGVENVELGDDGFFTSVELKKMENGG